MKLSILVFLLISLNTYSQNKIHIELQVNNNKNDLFFLNERSLSLSNKNELTFESKTIKNYLVYNFPTNDYKRFIKDYKNGIIPDSIFKLTIDQRKIDLSDFTRLDNDDIIELLLGIDLNNTLLIIPNSNNNQTFNDDSVYQFKLDLESKKEYKLENIQFKNINYHLGLDSSYLDLFANLKIEFFKDDLKKSKLYFYNNTRYTGKFSINDTTFLINVGLLAAGLDFKYKYSIDYKIQKEQDSFDKLIKDDVRTYRQGDTINIGYYSIFLDSIEKFGKKAYLNYKINKDFYSETVFFSNLTLKNIVNQKKLTPLNKNGYKILDFWASWCLPCLKQHSIIEKNYKQLKSKNISIIGINIDANDLAKSKKYLEKRNFPWSNFGLVNSNDANKFMISTYPTYILLSPKNTIIMSSNNINNVIEFLNKL